MREKNYNKLVLTLKNLSDRSKKLKNYVKDLKKSS